VEACHFTDAGQIPQKTASAGKVMASVFSDSEEVMKSEYLERVNTVMHVCYAQLIRKRRQLLRKKNAGEICARCAASS